MYGDVTRKVVLTIITKFFRILARCILHLTSHVM
jgi:hypothetical protein